MAQYFCPFKKNSAIFVFSRQSCHIKTQHKHSESNIIIKHLFNCICNMNCKSMGYGKVLKIMNRKAEGESQFEQ